MNEADLPFLDLTAPGFSTKGPDVAEARQQSWAARTPFGLAVLRHRQAGQLLRDRRLRQGSYAWPDKLGLSGPFTRFWKDSVIGREGSHHKALRRIAMTALHPDYILSLSPTFERIAEDLANGLTGSPSVEFVDAFSEPFAGRAITTLLGLPDRDAPQIAHDAGRLGLAMGLDAKSHEHVFNSATERLTEQARDLIARARTSGQTDDFIGRMVQAADGADDQTLEDLVVIAIFGGVDTTRAQLAFAMALFARHPEQWERLRTTPLLIPNAIEEVIRAWPTTTWSTREAVEAFEFEGVNIQAGTTIHVLVHATGTDPAAVPDWNFDVSGKRKMHFGFGGGAHHCLGQLVARTDMAAALRVIARRFETIEIAGTPRWLPDSGNTSPLSLPLSFS